VCVNRARYYVRTYWYCCMYVTRVSSPLYQQLVPWILMSTVSTTTKQKINKGSKPEQKVAEYYYCNVREIRAVRLQFTLAWGWGVEWSHAVQTRKRDNRGSTVT
jgi:hypothetical protein